MPDPDYLLEKGEKLKVGECREVEEKHPDGTVVVFKLCKPQENALSLTPLRIVKPKKE